MSEQRDGSDDRRLVTRLLAGDEEAFATFFDTNFPRLFRFALSRLGSVEAAEDVVQATFAKAFPKLHTWRGEAALFTWLTTICRHELGAHAVRSGQWVARLLPDDDPEIRARLETLATDPASAPDRLLEGAEMARLVQATLDFLPTHYGDALEWKYLQGCSVAEIAARLGSTPKAAESLLTRAREAFRDAFDRHTTVRAAGDPMART